MTVRIVDIVCEKDTNNAILVSIDGEDFWIPKSQIEEESEVYKKDTEGVLIISDWIADKKGLESSE